jgi:hypothetical protein
VAAGRALLSRLTAGDWEALRRGYDLGPAVPELAAALGAAQQAPAAARLDGYLDLVAAHLATQGFRVDRLPLLVVPVRLLADTEGVSGSEFLIGWNNVVLETTHEGHLRAEGFSSLVPSGDALARRTFAAAGCRLDLLPALVHSIVLDGGYRCASNHLRARQGAMHPGVRARSGVVGKDAPALAPALRDGAERRPDGGGDAGHDSARLLLAQSSQGFTIQLQDLAVVSLALALHSVTPCTAASG